MKEWLIRIGKWLLKRFLRPLFIANKTIFNWRFFLKSHRSFKYLWEIVRRRKITFELRKGKTPLITSIFYITGDFSIFVFPSAVYDETISVSNFKKEIQHHVNFISTLPLILGSLVSYIYGIRSMLVQFGIL
jgi:hypothetical protein